MPWQLFFNDTATGVMNDDTPMDPVSVEVKELTQSEENLIGQMQTIIQFFLDLLQVIGGDLAPEKCVWFRCVTGGRTGKRASLRCNIPIGE
jgi:hypothetical protein